MISVPEVPYAAEGIAGARPVWTVRNTFVDWLAGEDETPVESIFSTWPLRSAADTTPKATAVEPHAESWRPEDQPEASLREDGELSESGEGEEDDLEEGELMEESEESEEGKVRLPNRLPEEPEEEEGEEEDGHGSLDGAPPPGPAPGLRLPATALSAGSLRHYEGLCKPCAWFYKPGGGCHHGEKCGYCHLCPPGEIARRKREKARRLLLMQRPFRRHSVGAVGPGLTEAAASSLAAAAAGGLSAGPVGGLLAASAPGSEAAFVMEPRYVEATMEPRYVEVAPQKPGQPRGALGHGVGQCRPCAWVHKGDMGGCKNGDKCKYCHLCPPGELKRRKRMKRMEQVLDQRWQSMTPGSGICGSSVDPCFAEPFYPVT